MTDSRVISQLGFPAGDPGPLLEAFWLEGLETAGKDRQRSRETYREGHRRPRKTELEDTRQETWFPSPFPTGFRAKPPRPEKASRELGADERLGRAVPRACTGGPAASWLLLCQGRYRGPSPGITLRRGNVLATEGAGRSH